MYEDLNEKQRAAVLQTEGPVLVLAGAGSGKTRVLTRRVAHLIRQGVHPLSVLAITFTNKAASEMKERIAGELDRDVSSMWISTFHALCVRILRMSGSPIGYSSNFIIYDSDDTLRLIKNILERLGLKEDKLYPPRLVRSAISKFKNTCGEDEDIFEFANKAFPTLSYRIKEIYQAYTEEMQKQNAMDFDDLLLNTLKLFRKDAQTLENYQNRFRYILVDEYQDTNMVQYHLVRLLAQKHKNLFVVGDDDQSIYAFRGASIANILNFEQDYPNAKVIRLEQNYRSDVRILNAANCVIKNNTGRKGKTLWSDIRSGEMPKVYTAHSEYDEAEFIAKQIRRAQEEGTNYRDIAVLYRIHTLSRNLEEKLRLYGIPYRVYGGMSFYERREIKDILAYLTLIENPAADIALMRVINTPKRGIGAATVGLLRELADRNNCSMMEVLADSDVLLAGQSCKKKLDRFYDLMCELSADWEERSVQEIIEDVCAKTDYYGMLAAEFPEDAQDRTENIGELMNSACEFEAGAEESVTLTDFLQNVALITDMDSTDEQGGVTLMTMHAAKGLEFDTVFIAGMEEGVFPSRRSAEEDNLEEERRLCYVAITRAKRCLFLTNSQRRAVFGDVAYNPPSRFLAEIKEEYLEYLTPKVPVAHVDTPAKKTVFSGGVPSFGKPAAKKPTDGYAPGMTVKHTKFGLGQIKSIAGTGEQRIAVVDFEQVGEKKMFLAFAPLEVV